MRAMGLVAVVLLMAATSTGCESTRAGRRCRGNGVAQDATNVLRCTKGRWQIALSKADALRWLADQQRRQPTAVEGISEERSPATTAAPAPAAPATTTSTTTSTTSTTTSTTSTTTTTTTSTTTSTTAPPIAVPMAPIVVLFSRTTSSIRFSWMGGGGSIATDVAEVSVDGGGYTTRPLSGSIDVASTCGQSHMVSVRVRRGSVVGPNQNASGVAAPCPSPSVAATQGGPNPAGAGTCAPGRCSYIVASLRNYPPGSTHTVSCGFEPEGTPFPVPPMTVTVDGTGAADVRTNCWIGQGGIDLWVDGIRFGPFNVDWRR